MSILPPKIEFRLIMAAKSWTYLITITGIVFLFLICISCGDGDKDTQPLLSRAQMVKALTEIYLTEQKVNRLGLPRDSSNAEFERFKHVIFEKVGVSDSAFKRSFDYYMDRPVEMEKIYSALVDSLSLMEQRLDAPNNK